MKWFVFLTLLTFVGCKHDEQALPYVNEKNVPMNLFVDRHSYGVSEWDFKGHTYIIIDREGAGGITHAGHCKCRINTGTGRDTLVGTHQ